MLDSHYIKAYRLIHFNYKKNVCSNYGPFCYEKDKKAKQISGTTRGDQIIYVVFLLLFKMFAFKSVY